MTFSPPVDWNNGTLFSLPDRREAAQTEETDAGVSLTIAGDWAPIRAFGPIIENDPVSIYGDLFPLISQSDLSIVNLEAPLSDQGEAVSKSGAVFKGEKKHISGLTSVPFDVVTLANNHMFDFGQAAFQETLAGLDENNINHVGAGNCLADAAKPLIMTVKGLTIAIVNFSEGEDLTGAGPDTPGVMGWDLPLMEETVRGLKGTVDFILVIAHCGIEYIAFPPPYVTGALQRMADAGADLVVGHHPHVPQGVTVHNGVPICYSLGNFVFYQDTRLFHRKQGYMVRATVKKNHPPALELIPYQIGDQGLALLDNNAKKAFFQKLKAVSLPLADTAGIDQAWQGFLHQYGTKGFINEISMLMKRMESEPRKGAAMFRNRLTTLQHFHHWKDALTRMVDGSLEDAPPSWARDLTHEWLHRTLDSHKEK